MNEISPQKPILVTGAAGFIASWIVKYLLDDGYTVHGTVRDKSNLVKVAHLEDMANKSVGKLHLFEADLLQQGSYAAAMKGCQLVIHTASPFQPKVKNPQKDLIEPALEGTRNVLQTVNELEEVQRVVLTSSVVAIMGDASEIDDTENGIFTEDHWNLSSSLKHQPYAYSKTLAEKEAWRMNQIQDRWTLAVINPAFVLGPSLSRRQDSFSTDFMLSMVNGKNRTGMPDLTFAIVDVRDVAQAHIKAGFNSNAKGRHVTCAETVKIMEMAAILQSFFGNKYPLPKRELPTWMVYIFGPLQGLSWKYLNKNLGFHFEFDNQYSIQDLGLEYRPVEETLVDQVKELEAKGLV